MNAQTEQRLKEVMMETYHESVKLGYRPGYFLRMLGEKGAEATARDLVSDPNYSTGFTELLLRHRLDLTVEDIITRDEFKEDFQELVLEAMKKLLKADPEHFNKRTPKPQGNPGADWSEAEVNIIVADYFDMLASELAEREYNKTEHRRHISVSLNGRSDGSIEFKHQNISAILVSIGLPYIEGYKPRGNFQALLATGVEQFVHTHPTLIEGFGVSVRLNPQVFKMGAAKAADLFVVPPERIVIPGEPKPPWVTRKGRKIDFAQRDAANRRLGKLGEQFVFELEQRRLKEAGRDDLAAKVEWISQTCGDGVGYDVLSFDETTEAEKWVEVKSTGLGKYFPFYVSINELRCSEAVAERYHLYRVFDFSRDAKLYVLPGALSQSCQLDAIQFLARFGKS